MRRFTVFAATPALPSCHAATLTALAGGGLLVAWYAGSREAAPDVAIYGARPARNSAARSPPFLLTNTPGRPEGNPVLFTDPGGGVWLFYVTLMGDKWTTSRMKLRRSADGGHTWGAERVLSPEPGWMARNRPLALPSGEWLLPTYDERDWTSFALISDDQGKTWRQGSRVTAPPGVIQPAIAPLADGRLLMLLRTGGSGGWIWQATSTDGGRTWSQATPTGVPNNNSGLDLIRLGDGHLLLACNPVADSKWRTPLSLLLSDDEGCTWHRWLDVETEPGEFSYPALLQADDGTIHMVYTYRRTAIVHVALNHMNAYTASTTGTIRARPAARPGLRPPPPRRHCTEHDQGTDVRGLTHHATHKCNYASRITFPRARCRACRRTIALVISAAMAGTNSSGRTTVHSCTLSGTVPKIGWRKGM